VLVEKNREEKHQSYLDLAVEQSGDFGYGLRHHHDQRILKAAIFVFIHYVE
jgi:hypothetical protein